MESVQHYIKEGILYKPVVPDIQQWPIATFFRRKKDVTEQVVAEAMAQLMAGGEDAPRYIYDLIAETMYLERIRMEEDPWKVDPKDEKKFWQQVKSGLVRNEQIETDSQAFLVRNEAMLREIVSRYANEISSTFRPGSYHFAKRVLPFIFSTLLNASAGKTLKSVIYHNVQLQEKVHLIGEIQAIRNLATKGTIVLVPTHISNVDSILVGWGLHALGLPAFIYGAGLNLYNNQILAYFMQRLGAYKVDRRKKNPIYRSTLNAYSTVAIENGVHGLFFPGGTRSRSGEIEKRLKLGLLGTAMEAQRRLFIHPPKDRSNKVFVVPLVMSYHFVLEAATLINQHLKSTGKEQYYIIHDEFASYAKFLKFVWQTFREKSEIALAFGKPIDLFGNFVDENGDSYDSQGRPVDVKDYFMSHGEIREDAQRDMEYTRLLGEKIVERYHVENRVFSSHLVAFAAFEILKHRHPNLDLYGLLRLPAEDLVFPLKAYAETVNRLLARLREMVDQGKVHLAEHMINDTMTIIEHGIKNLGIYHAKRALSFTKEGTIISEDMNLLYYYHNRLEGYGLEAYIA